MGAHTSEGHRSGVVLGDDDVVRYWSVVGPDDSAAWCAVAGTGAASFELARHALGRLDPDSELHRVAELRMLRHVNIDATTFQSAMLEDLDRREAALANPHHAAAVAELVARRGAAAWQALRNPALDPAVLADLADRCGYLELILENPNMPTSVIERHVALRYHQITAGVLEHPNTPRDWVLEALDCGGPLAAAAIHWPGFDAAELAELAAGVHPNAAGSIAHAAQLVLEARFSAPGERRIPRLRHGFDRGVAELLRARLTLDTQVAAAARLARSGFAGTVDELCAVAATFS